MLWIFQFSIPKRKPHLNFIYVTSVIYYVLLLKYKALFNSYFKAALDCAVHYANQRQAFGSSILKLQAIQVFFLFKIFYRFR